MKGWEYSGAKKPLKLVEKEDPKALPGHVVIKTMACGLCHSDVGALEDASWEPMFNLPVIMGHEFAGEIVEIGEGVTKYKVGDRVGVWPLEPGGTSGGYTRDGGYSTMATAPESQCVPIPDGLSYAYAAAGTDAGMTSYHAVVVQGGAKPGLKMGIIGIGGLGQVAARIAVLKGCEVYVSSRKKEARDAALALGCKAAVETAIELAQFNCDVIIDFAGATGTSSDAIAAVKPHGRVVLVGMANVQPVINMMPLILKEVEFVGSVGGSDKDIADVYEMMASGDLKMDLIEVPLEKVADGLEQLHQGGVRGRLVYVNND